VYGFTARAVAAWQRQAGRSASWHEKFRKSFLASSRSK
jgi:hypothetical protein